MDIILKNISKSFGDKKVLENFDIEFKEGQITCIMGASGSGKTTLLYLLLGLLKPDSGEIKMSDKISVMFQEDRLCEDFTAVDNISVVLKNYDKKLIKKHLKSVGIDDNALISNFSGGMKRRVALVRAIMYDCEVVLLDEPFKGLDEDTRQICIDYIKQNLNGRTLIMITHYVDEVELMGGKLINIDK